MSVPSAWRSCFTDSPRSSARETAGRAFARLRKMAPATDAELAEALSLATGHVISPALLDIWCDPTGPRPPFHWIVILARLIGPAAGPVLAELAQ